MQVIHAGEEFEARHPSLFLAGPAPRSSEVRSWRPRALEMLRELNFTGMVLVPEPRDGSVKPDYLDQVEWEFAGLEYCSVITFWVPRDLNTLPGFTTNIEFGRYVGSGRCVYGRPENAPRTRYLDWLYRKLTGRKPHDSLEATLKAGLEAVGRRNH